MRLAEVRQLDEVVLLRYLLGEDGPAARGEARARPDRDDAGAGGPQDRGTGDPDAGGTRGGPGAGDGGDRDPDAGGTRGEPEGDRGDRDPGAGGIRGGP
jgi:hypothetical protein